MKTSMQWWNEVKKDQDKLIDWLKRQYYGECVAAIRIKEFNRKFPSKWDGTLTMIRGQEQKHAAWIRTLLENRNVNCVFISHDERYWKETLSQIDSFDTGAAVAAHAEAMRLERIRVIANDPETPQDIKDVFTKILPEEEFHAKAFKTMATEMALRSTLPGHLNGLKAINLIPMEL